MATSLHVLDTRNHLVLMKRVKRILIHWRRGGGVWYDGIRQGSEEYFCPPFQRRRVERRGLLNQFFQPAPPKHKPKAFRVNICAVFERRYAKIVESFSCVPGNRDASQGPAQYGTVTFGLIICSRGCAPSGVVRSQRCRVLPLDEITNVK